MENIFSLKEPEENIYQRKGEFNDFNEYLISPFDYSPMEDNINNPFFPPPMNYSTQLILLIQIILIIIHHNIFHIQIILFKRIILILYSI